MPRQDHWLWRLSDAAWIAAARRELAQGHAKQHSRRAAVVHARRAAGMALNGVLVNLGTDAEPPQRDALELRWGRSYVDHLRAVAGDDPEAHAPLAPTVAQAADELLKVQLNAEVVPLRRGSGDAVQSALTAAGQIVDGCAAVVGP